MKTKIGPVLVFGLCSLILPSLAFGSDNLPMETLFPDEPLHVSGYGGPAAQFTGMKGNFGFLLGGRGGAIFNDSVVVGGALYGLVQPAVNAQINGSDQRISLGYGGLLLEYDFFPKNLVNFSVGTIVGSGGVGEFSEHRARPAPFFVLQPEVNVFVNVTRFFKLGTGVAYRYSNGINLNGFTDDDFRGFSGSLLLEFGQF